MANLFLETPTYITEAQLKESTRVTDTELIGTNDDAVNNRKILIRKSEIVIDSIIWTYGTKVDSDQETVFPTVSDWVPKNIMKAVVLICEGMFLGWELTQSKEYVGAKFAKAEWYGDHKVEFQNETVQTNAMSKKNQYITQEIEMLLKPFVTTSSGVKWSKSV